MRNHRLILFLTALITMGSCNKDFTSIVLGTEGIVSFWNFGGPTPFESVDEHHFTLIPGEGTDPETVEDGPVSGQSVSLDGHDFLFIPYEQTGALNLHTNAVTVMAWVKWTGEQIGFVGGMWNEYQDGGKRQYGLFVSLPHYNGADQVCGHISKNGGPTPPFPYSIDYSASKQTVPPGEWSCVAFTYDGEYIRSYFNGVCEARDPELIDHTVGFEGYPDGLVQSKNPYYYPDGMGDNGSDFTVGAVLLHSGMGNFFKGQIGGLAVFDRALTDSEILCLYEASR